MSTHVDLAERFSRAAGLHERGRLEEAESLYRGILEANEQLAPVWSNLATLLEATGRLPEALRAFETALRVDPHHEGALCGLATALQALGRASQARGLFARVLDGNPNHLGALNNCAMLFEEAGSLDEAQGLIDRALEVDPSHAQLWITASSIALKRGRVAAAISAAERVLSMDERHAGAHCQLAHALIRQGHALPALQHMARAVDGERQRADWHSSLLMFMHYTDRMEPSQLRAEHERWARLHGKAEGAFQATVTKGTSLWRPGRPLRVAYLSPDFRTHPVAFFIEAALRHFDPKRVRPFVYANVRSADATSQRIKNFDVVWRDVAGLPAARVCEMLRADGIDILVDLAGHTHGHRLDVLSQQPAFVQMTYLGYPNTTGLSQVDARLTDARADPAGYEAFTTEKLLRLDGGFLCFTPPEGAPDVSSGAEPRPFTFGSFNNTSKVGDACIRRWASILRQLPDARMLVQYHVLSDEETARDYRQRFEAHGVKAEQVLLRGGSVSYAEHLRRHEQVDLILDAYPYNGTTTTCEALWMGTPVLTQAGDRHVARVGASLLWQLGLTSFVVETEEAFVQQAVRLASAGREALSPTGPALRARMAQSPLCDPKRFNAELQDAFERAMLDKQAHA